jgi:hypothetical protein
MPRAASLVVYGEVDDKTFLSLVRHGHMRLDVALDHGKQIPLRDDLQDDL